MASQSWAAWLLDAYASSVSPVASEQPERVHDGDESPASATSQTSTTRSMSAGASPLSPYGPYARTGRGGAGNFHWQSNDDAQPDLEAQNTSSLSERRQAAAKLERIETGEAMKTRKSSQYLHMGRGGAGNFTQSNEIQSAKSPRAVSSPVVTLTPTLGRGGAGNFGVAADTKKQLQAEKEEREREEAEKRRGEIEEQVSGMLQPPPGAMLSNRRSSMVLEQV